MRLIDFLALAANVASALILLKYKDGDASVWFIYFARATTRLAKSQRCWRRSVFGAAQPLSPT
jgi:hypothetical protein